MTELPKATVKRLMKESSGLRVSEEAVEHMSEHLESVLREKTDESVDYTEHADRSTIQDKDVKMALK